MWHPWDSVGPALSASLPPGLSSEGPNGPVPYRAPLSASRPLVRAVGEVHACNVEGQPLDELAARHPCEFTLLLEAVIEPGDRAAKTS